MKNAQAKVGVSVERGYLYTWLLAVISWASNQEATGFRVLLLNISTYLAQIPHLFLAFYMHNSSVQILPVSYIFNISLSTKISDLKKQKLSQASHEVF